MASIARKKVPFNSPYYAINTEISFAEAAAALKEPQELVNKYNAFR